MKTGTYRLSIYDYNSPFKTHYVRVEIIGESEKSYRVRYEWDCKIVTKWVRKHNVRLDKPVITRGFDQIRLPYKN